MTPQNLTRQFYDRTPYPPPKPVRSMRWRLPPLDWILSIDRPRVADPRRALVAGCGSGSEAFLLQRALKDTEITAVDFSAESIGQAQKTQAREPSLRRIRFMEADLQEPNLPAKAGGPFDLVVCHGVMSYIPQLGAALHNLSQCLSPDGVLYLGVNGADHFSEHLRPVLAKLGFNLNVAPPKNQWWPLLEMWEAGHHPGLKGRWTRLPDWYFGSDFFGPLFHNLPLRQWIEILRQSGLFLRAQFIAHRALRPIMDAAAERLFMSRSRGEVCELLETMHPTSFHHLLLTHKADPTPPWKDGAELRAWRPARSGLYKASYPRQVRRSGLGNVVLKSRALETQFDWPMPRWEMELLRRCDGTKPIAELLRGLGKVPSRELGEQLFLLYQFAVLNVFPP